MKGYHRLVAVALLWLTGALRLHHIAHLGTQADEGIHITIAEQLATGNGRLYQDLFENRTPGVEWLLAGLFKMSSATILMGRTVSVGMALITVAALFVAAREIVGQVDAGSHIPNMAGYLAMGLFALAPLPLFWARFTMLEHFAAAAAVASVAATVCAINRQQSSLWFLAGVLGGVATCFKQSELVLFAAMLLFFIAFALLAGYRQAAHATFLWAAGYATPLILLLITLVVQGSLGDFLHFLSGAERLAPLTNLSAKSKAWWAWAIRRPIVPLTITGLLVAIGQRTPGLLLAGLFAVSTSGALLLPVELDLQPGGFSHYIIVPLAACALLAASGTTILWRRTKENRFLRSLVLPLVLLSVLITAPGWFSDLASAIQEGDYPQAGFANEIAIGEAAAMLTPTEGRMVVLGNSIFFHWAKRLPANRFFHFPEYFNTSSVGQEAVNEIVQTLTGSQAETVLVSRFHLQERLPDEILSALWQHWTPVARFPYPYQQDLFIFRRRTPSATATLAEVGQHIMLVKAEVEELDAHTFLLELQWQAQTPPEANYSVFVHVLAPDGQLIAQADSIPAVGFRPTMTWQNGEVIVDYHWITLPVGTDAEMGTLSIGLYQPENNERLPVRISGHETEKNQNAFTIPLKP